MNAKRFLNQPLINVALNLKRPDTNIPHAPVTVSVAMRTLFAKFKRQEVPWKLEDFKGWEGALIDVVDSAFNEYLKRDTTCGVKQRKEFTDDDYAKICLFVSELSADQRVDWLRNIVQFTLGTQFGFRGRQEHRDLKCSDISFGLYPLTAEKDLAGKQFVQIGGQMLHKANKLGLKNPTARQSNEGGIRFICDMEDPLNVGRALHELLSRCHSSQTYLYHHNLSQKEKKKYVLAGQGHVLYNPNRPVGKNTIAEYLPALACAAGIQEWQSKSPHALRAYFITKLANDPEVNAKETAEKSRHKNVSSQNAYIHANEKSAVKSFKALANPYAESALENATTPAQSALDTQTALLHRRQIMQQQRMWQQQQMSMQVQQFGAPPNGMFPCYNNAMSFPSFVPQNPMYPPSNMFPPNMYNAGNMYYGGNGNPCTGPNQCGFPPAPPP